MSTAATAGPEQELVLPADDGLGLAGTLALPDGPGPHPAALLLAGSGPLDRESDAGARLRLGLGRPLAAALAARGVASYRFDRRGVGATGGGDWRAVGFARNRDDAAAALRGLRAHPAVRADAVAVIGHSEGALHAAALGAQDRAAASGAQDRAAASGVRDDADRSGVGDDAAAPRAPEDGGAPGHPVAVVLLAPSARPGADVLRWQASQLAGDLPAPVRLLLRLLRTDLARQQARNAARVLATTTDVARIGGVRVNARWHREFLAHDPRDDLAALSAPVLAITGAKDVQVPPDDLGVVAQLVPGAEVRLVPDLTHVLRRDPAPASLRRYRALLRGPVDGGLLADVAGWTAGALRAGRAPSPAG